MAPLRALSVLLGPLLLVLLAPPPEAGAQPCDLLLRGGAVVDGTGAPRYRGDVAVAGDRIARIDPDGIAPVEARLVIDARGHVVAPGFIDNHAHVQSRGWTTIRWIRSVPSRPGRAALSSGGLDGVARPPRLACRPPPRP